MRLPLALLIAAAIPLALAHSGVTQSLGAHPFWAVKIAYIGVPVGLALAVFTLLLPKWPAATGLALLTLAAFALAHYGKTQFAASYAEDTLAGQFWYFGWIATLTFLTASVAAIFRPSRRARM